MSVTAAQLLFHAERSERAGNHATAIFCREAAAQINMPKSNDDAFPSSTSDGMSLRDWFAGQALMGMVQPDRTTPDDCWPDYTNAAANAFRYADAMIARRSQ